MALSMTSPPPRAGSLQAIVNRIAARTDAIAAIAILLGVGMLVAPIPPAVLDFMLAISISSSVLILIGATYAKSMLDYSSLPTVLLITTMYRLSLEVAVTRVVLLEAHAGEIVQTFGEIVAGGNLAVGIVIFAIMTVVNFVVITKGSERVAEVGARFSLDAMPGRQMSIDAELRSGLITQDEANARRTALTRESQMHGAMDGAMKFVKGDAIAGIVILVVNLIGGLVVGTQLHGMSLGEAARVYSVLSIGEGLVSQLPALLISVAAGLLITLSEPEDRTTPGGPGRIIARELFGAPGVVLSSGLITAGLGLLPGMPAGPFVPLGLLLAGGAAYRMYRTARTRQAEDAAQGVVVQDELYFRAAEPYRLRITVPEGLVAVADELESAMRQTRNGIVAKGYMLPAVQAERSGTPNGDRVRVEFLVNEVPFIDAELAVGEACVRESVAHLDALGVPASTRAIRRGGVPITILDAAARTRAESAGVQTLALTTMVCRAIEEVIWATSSSFISVREAQRMLNWALRNNPELYEEAKKVVPAPTLAQIIQRLAAERVAVRNGFVILDTLCRWVPKEREIELLTEQVRLELRYEICQQVAPDGALNVVLLSPHTEDLVRSSLRKTAVGSYVALAPDETQGFLDRLRQQCAAHQTLLGAFAVVTSEDLRPHVRRLIADDLPSVPVLSFAELTSHVAVTPVGEVGLESA